MLTRPLSARRPAPGTPARTTPARLAPTRLAPARLAPARLAVALPALTLAALALLALAVLVVPAAAQTLPEGWQLRADRPDVALEQVEVVDMPPGYHIHGPGRHLVARR
jgi:hypothetical protein